jgi:putative hydrolase of the HAD superfamily
MIEAVFFDLYETLVTEQGIDVPRAARLGPTLGLDDKAYRVQWRLQRPRVIRGDLTFSAALMEIGALLNARLDPAVVKRVVHERIQARRTVFERIDQELVALTRHLGQQGRQLAVISNCFAEDVEAWPGCAFAPQFGCAVFSFSVGLAKPEPEIYKEAARRLGVDPAHALFVGDHAVDELLGAERAGLRAVRVDWFVKPTVDHPGFAAVPCVSTPQDLLAFVSAG